MKSGLDFVLELATERLKKTPGIVACKILASEDRDFVSSLESSATIQEQLLGMRITNEGIKDVMSKTHVVLIAHSKELRHPPGPIIVIHDTENTVGEEIWQPEHLAKLSNDPNAILLGKSLVLYRDALARARGKSLTLSYRALPFPELDEIAGVSDVVSVTIGPFTHVGLSQKVGWNFINPDLGTVLIGFNSRN